MNFTGALFLDATLLLTCLWCIWQGSERSLFNPAYWWAGIHFYSVTFRLFTLAMGAASPSFLGIKSDTELLKAAYACDLTLIGVTVATVAVPYLLRDRGPFVHPGQAAQLYEPLGKILVWVCIGLGVYSMVKVGALGTAALMRGLVVSRLDTSEVQGSYFYIINGFAVQGCVLWFAMRGFTRKMVLLMIPLLLATALSNSRAFFILPLLLCFLIGQTRDRSRKIPVGWVIGFVLLGVTWFVSKAIVPALIADASVQTVWNLGQNEFENKVDSSSADTAFLDMQAVYMAAADEQGKRYYGGTILPLLSLPIPRALWPEKPAINAYAGELSTGEREISRMGLSANLSGESYVNMGWFGSFFIPFLYMAGMQIAFLWSKDDVGFSARWWLYLIFLVSMLQVYRDGLISVVIFPMLYNAPLFVWGVASRLRHRFQVFQQPVAAQLALEP